MLSGNSSGSTTSTKPLGGPSSGSASAPRAHTDAGLGVSTLLTSA